MARSPPRLCPRGLPRPLRAPRVPAARAPGRSPPPRASEARGVPSLRPPARARPLPLPRAAPRPSAVTRAPSSRPIPPPLQQESVPVSSYQQAGTPADLKREIARLGINMLLKMIFVDNFVHGDLHPGNILVQGADGLSPSLETQQQQVNVRDTLVATLAPALCPLRLVLLDAGIVAELQASDLRNFRAVFLAVVLGQGHRVAELILHHARANECKDVERFKAEMATLVTQARENTMTLEKLHVSSLLSSVFKLLMIHKVKLESNFASIVFAIMVLEGLGRSLDPKLDILEAAKPFLLRGGGFL
ncbi:uncharacterized aarF domain-containing protein kinase 2 [Peromyscus eremicus]|uniref:uncharacterized aarF domain-containing protein kinase 2 n=1 Tax=Peromyscus eremicus TaxID=42410 RepID=UPI0027DCE8B4|nr:uncharacterized aarF domain-containing protein kinase 2 [Peromyscus eremicus]